MSLSEHVYCAAITFKMTKWVEQWICNKFCVKLERSSAETIWMIQKAAAMGYWWLAASSQQHSCSCIISHAEFLVKHQITQVTQPLYSLDLAPCDYWISPKITYEREEISGHWWGSGKYNEAADCNWENCVKSQGDYFEEEWGFTVLYTIFFVPFIFFNKYIYFSYYMAGYLLDTPHCMFPISWIFFNKCLYFS